MGNVARRVAGRAETTAGSPPSAVWALAWPGLWAAEQLCLPVFQLGFYKGPAGSQVTLSSLGNQTRVLLEEQARHLLNEQERATMAYYLEEYRGGSVSVDALVMALFELLNTHAKVTCTPPWARDRPAGRWQGLSAALKGSASLLAPLCPYFFTRNPQGVRSKLSPEQRLVTKTTLCPWEPTESWGDSQFKSSVIRALTNTVALMLTAH